MKHATLQKGSTRRAANEKLKKELSTSKAKATRLENARKKLVKEKDAKIASLKEEIEDLQDENEQLDKLANPETLVGARLETARMRQAIGRFGGIAERIMMKCDLGGVSIKSTPSRPTLPKALLELKPSFFDEYDCREEILAETDYSLLLKGFASQAGKEQCWIRHSYGRVMAICFKNADEDDYTPALSLNPDDDLEWVPIEANAPYACIFEMNSFVLLQATQKLSPLLLEFSNRDQPNAVVITDSNDHLGGGQREYLWRSLPGDHAHANDFKADFTSAAPDTNLRVYVDPKYLRRCVMASSDAGSKTVELALREDTLRLRYGNEHFSLTYCVPTVKPTENGERSYSPIEFGTEVFDI